MTHTMKTMTLEEFRAALQAQGVEREDYAFRCPMCETVQSARDLIAAGAGANLDEVRRYEGFSCIGRFTGAGSPSKAGKGNGCNWTLGGFFQMHRLEVLTEDGERHPRLEPVTPEEAQAHRDRVKA